MSETILVPEVTLRDWRKWFAWYPVRLKGGGMAWLRHVERRDYWFISYFAEFRTRKGTPK